MNTKIKLCGIMREEDVSYVNRLKPDYIGFVFAKSRRMIDGEKGFLLRQKLDASIEAVGVFVNERVEEISLLAKRGTIQIVQLHGGESEEYIRKLKETCQIPIIKVIRVGKEELQVKETAADYYLFDNESGGSGQTFSWNLIPKTMKKPFFLAGGLKKDNIIEAIQKVNPYAVDLSSGVETSGFKDFEKMQGIFKRLKGN